MHTNQIDIPTAEVFAESDVSGVTRTNYCSHHYTNLLLIRYTSYSASSLANLQSQFSRIYMLVFPHNCTTLFQI
jgi:hypothetical protein